VDIVSFGAIVLNSVVSAFPSVDDVSTGMGTSVATDRRLLRNAIRVRVRMRNRVRD
jgi:hypothetical protein